MQVSACTDSITANDRSKTEHQSSRYGQHSYCQVSQNLIVPDPTAPSTGLYFTLNGVVYLPGDTVLITDIGIGVRGNPDPGSSLVCNTSNVNTHCCRGGDNPYGGSMGEWYFPNGTILPRFKDNPDSDFTTTVYTYQIRLDRKSNATTPLGTYECRVPHMDNTSTEVHNATIIISGRPFPYI